MTFSKPGEGLSPRNGRKCQPLLPRASPVPHAALLAAILATDSAAGPQGLTLPPDLSMAASPHHVGLAQMPLPRKGAKAAAWRHPSPILSSSFVLLITLNSI